MARLTAREAAMLRMALDDEARTLSKDAPNTSSDLRGEYPRMLYRKTDEEDRRVQTVDKDGRDREVIIANRFDGLLCETMIAESIDEAEALAADGWDTTPRAAYGLASGIVAATSAKDDEIAALRAELEAARATNEEPARRGPGRPHTDAVAA